MCCVIVIGKIVLSSRGIVFKFLLVFFGWFFEFIKKVIWDGIRGIFWLIIGYIGVNFFY